MSSTAVEELSIPCPCGSIAAKAWGQKSGFPVLAIHGWLDNAGSYDKLIPLLSKSFYIIAIDLIGHGYSSHKPDGQYYHFVDWVIDIKRIAKYFRWNKFSLIGHSLGGALAIMYGCLFPEDILNIVSLDMIKPTSRKNETSYTYMKDTIKNILSFESKLNASDRVYTPEDAKHRLIEGTYNEISSESADVLMKRGSKPSKCGKGVVFARDIRVKFSDYKERFSHNVLETYLKKLRCNLMIISAQDTLYKLSPKLLKGFLNIYEEYCKGFVFVEVPGTHFVHLNNPKIVADFINSFFDTYNGDQELEVKSKL